MTATFRIDVQASAPGTDHHLAHEAKLLGLGHLGEVRRSRYYLVQGELDEVSAQRLGDVLLSDPVLEKASLGVPVADGRNVIEVQRKTGVMDPIEASIVKGAADLGIVLTLVRVGTRVEVAGAGKGELEILAWKALANQAIEEAAIDPAEPIRLRAPGGSQRHPRTEVDLAGLDAAALMELSKAGTLSLTLDEMQAIQDHFRALGRRPTDVELESLAQTWSEHCVHKTLKGLVEYTGPTGVDGAQATVLIDNLLKQTIAKATKDLAAPWCLSVFKDNSGVIAYDERYGVCIKVETHNRPSAIEPYGGANTGLGGVVRDVIGTGVGAKPIFNTDVFCFGELDADPAKLPPGTIHPRRLMRGVVNGVRDYGNRMGIPTVNGAIRFDPRYVGNPLVFCGTGGLIPLGAIEKAACVGDHLIVIGGRTGRDGIHGATFSSAELHDKSEVVSSGAVQIGNAIEEKKVLDTTLQARDRGLFSALTDCGAGGLSSACGEISAEHGCRIDLERVPLKYDGLSYTEIWISESQERMVATVPAARVAECLQVFAAEGVEATDIGVITGSNRLELRFNGEQVADLDMHFLHDGVPRLKRPAVFTPVTEHDAVYSAPDDLAEALRRVLARPNVASKEWVIRQYDHEVQAGSIVKPLVGVMHDGPSDAAVIAPEPGRDRGVAVACGLNTNFSDWDAYHAAAAGIEEALRNLVCVGAQLERVAILDNFSWAKCTDPQVFGALVRACQACYDFAMYYGTPFISGKDSLSNEFTYHGKTIRIPHTLLITAMTVVEDVRRSITMDVKQAGDVVIAVGLTRNELGGSEYLALLSADLGLPKATGGIVPKVDRALSRPVLHAVAACTAAGLVNAAHDVSDGGLATTLAEMAFAGGLGMTIDAGLVPHEGITALDRLLFSESQSRIVITVPAARVAEAKALLAAVPHAVVGMVTAEPVLTISGLGSSLTADLAGLKEAWQGTLKVMEN
ncbi:MAG: phosphoribosylformylglycinamidine synthase subunit PurL [Planctomycetes bacterium]|nr:phosphoribosylformylglycinamidine synthase subunit PurL [Planctomycetota bacterium]